ncbi:MULTISPECIES: DUF5695 domain-containing protein [Flavobacteriaceae]|uniref:DUF5695 domain-containing protein n=1 Tax=Flavobacteriaceae TaxID=49546 RepID=UPI001C0EAF51|nr:MULTISPECIES: DUF5695 domain-containing protein [Allomuricauda]MDC6365875.1 DUF5695 domain-containing protein [Muricauda sp. AC10]
MNIKYWVLSTIFLTGITTINAQRKGYWSEIQDKESTLGIADVYQKFDTPDFQLKLVRASQTVAALRPKSDPNFDFTPSDRLEIRDKDGLYHLGDINLRIRTGQDQWKSYSTATHRKAVTPLEATGTVLAAADLANTLPNDIPVSIKRYYELHNDQLVLRFSITNKTSEKVEIGALGIPMVFNNILEGKSLEETHKQNVFYDPYIGLDAGYLEVKRLNGNGQALLVLPEANMAFEAYRPLLDDPTPRSIVFEGFHEWMPHSKAYAENEWKGVEQWNQPTSLFLQADETRNFSLKLVLAEDVRNIQKTLEKENRPVAIGVPGYVLPKGDKAKLFLKYTNEVISIEVRPKKALQFKKVGKVASGAVEYQVEGKQWGRSCAIITYADGIKQSINYKVIESREKVVENLGEFLFNEQWFDDPNDPFGRTYSVITYDYQAKRQLTQDGRVWFAGLSDEAGSGSWVAAIMKQFLRPKKSEVKKFEQFIDSALWGGLQYSSGDKKYGVKKSMFYYEPEKMPKGTYSDTLNYNTWGAWNQEHANDPGRSFNYPHAAAAYWVMYRLARYHEGLVENHDWKWYLEKAYHTSIAMVELAPYYAQFGNMEGSVFLEILLDLQREGMTDMARTMENTTKERASRWKELDYPFGSEMPWDSTGQEEVYTWCDYFGFDHKARVTLDAILAYMPSIPHWGYNGNARRYWDFLYGGQAGKTSRVERQIHHYGSGMNAIPVLKAYRKNPDLYLLRVGYGGALGAISNITQNGFMPAAFHSYPSTLRIDYVSGDNGPGFFGYAMNEATYLTQNDDLGWLAFGGNLSQQGDIIEVEPTTAGRSRLFIAPQKLWLTLDAGTFEKVVYNTKTGTVELTLNGKTEYTPNAFLRVNKEINLPYEKIRGAYRIPLNKSSVQLQW